MPPPTCTGAVATVQALLAPDLGPAGSPWLSVKGSKLGKGTQVMRDVNKVPSQSRSAGTQGNRAPSGGDRNDSGLPKGVGSEGVRVYFSGPCL